MLNYEISVSARVNITKHGQCHNSLIGLHYIILHGNNTVVMNSIGIISIIVYIIIFIILFIITFLKQFWFRAPFLGILLNFFHRNHDISTSKLLHTHV